MQAEMSKLQKRAAVRRVFIVLYYLSGCDFSVT
jgi:hypothetical protein